MAYAELATRIRRAAAVLAGLGVGPGDAVAYLGLNSPAMLVLLFACARQGAMFVPLNWRLAPPEHARVLADCPPRALFVEPAFAAHGEAIGGAIRTHEVAVLDRDAGPPPPAAGDEESPLLLCYTSGLHRRAEGRGADAAGARLERGQQHAHARSDQRRTAC